MYCAKCVRLHVLCCWLPLSFVAPPATRFGLVEGVTPPYSNFEWYGPQGNFFVGTDTNVTYDTRQPNRIVWIPSLQGPNLLCSLYGVIFFYIAYARLSRTHLSPSQCFSPLTSQPPAVMHQHVTVVPTAMAALQDPRLCRRPRTPSPSRSPATLLPT